MLRFTLPRLFAAIVVVAFVAWVTGHLYRNQQAEQHAYDLVRGDRSIGLAAFRLENQQRRVICSDPKLLAYFAEALRQSDPSLRGGGFSYRLTLTFDDGTQTKLYSYWGPEVFELSVPQETSEEGNSTRGVAFPQPLLPEVAEMLLFLARPYQEVKGKVLILQSGGNRWDFDPQL